MATIQAAIAANRFGLGARPGELDEIGSDHADWLLSQLEARDTAPAQPMTTAELLREVCFGAAVARKDEEARRRAVDSVDDAQLGLFGAASSQRAARLGERGRHGLPGIRDAREPRGFVDHDDEGVEVYDTRRVLGCVLARRRHVQRDTLRG